MEVPLHVKGVSAKLHLLYSAESVPYLCVSIYVYFTLSFRWELSPFETSLLSLFLCCLPPAACRDIPIYLPKASSKVAHRLVIFTLFDGMYVN